MRRAIRLREPSVARGFPGEIHNLSEGGLYVTAPWLPPPGHELLGVIDTGGERVRFRGRVAWAWEGWRSPVANRMGAGIQFVDLSRAGQARLLAWARRTDAAAGLSDAQVWFEGRLRPVRGRVRSHGDTLDIVAPLHMLRVGTQVRVRVRTDAGVENRIGRLDDVRVVFEHEPDGVTATPYLVTRIRAVPCEARSGELVAKPSPLPTLVPACAFTGTGEATVIVPRPAAGALRDALAVMLGRARAFVRGVALRRGLTPTRTRSSAGETR